MKRIILFLSLLSILSFNIGCGIQGEEAIEIAEEAVQKEINEPNSYIKASEAIQNRGIWDIIVNVTIFDGPTTIDGHYLVRVDPDGEIIKLELKKMGNFQT